MDIVISEETIVRLKNSQEEAAEEKVSIVYAPEEVMKKEFSNFILPIFVSVSDNNSNLIRGNVYHNSIPLENLNQPESEKASDIFVMVTKN